MANEIEEKSGLSIKIEQIQEKLRGTNKIFISLNDTATSLGDEGYRLNITENRIIIEALKPAGCFYAIMTLRQMMTWQSEDHLTIPCVEIMDKPAYLWRGLLFDPARYFLPVDTLKDYIIRMAHLKLNKFQLHLTDDQGWRIEIKKYPELTGAVSNPLNVTKGYYTQSELKELVKFAKDYHIEIIPEFEMPGHAFAAVSTYPYLCCSRKPVPNPGMQKDLFCAGRDSTYEFLKGVLEEIVELFPSRYIHLGGDEAPKDRWIECRDCQAKIKELGLSGENELQGYLFRQMNDFLSKKNRVIIGWEEILDCNVPNDIIIHWWKFRGNEDRYAIRALQEGYKLICSPNKYTYINFPDTLGPLGRFLTLEEAYSKDYTPGIDSIVLPEEQLNNILGVQACLWGIFDIQYQYSLMYPRIIAIAEKAWSSINETNFPSFLKRLPYFMVY